MKIAVTGWMGRLGSYFVNELDCEPIKADIRNLDELYRDLHSVKPDVLINCAGYTNVDLAEHYVDECISSNVTGVKNLLELFQGEHFIQISSSYVLNHFKRTPLQYDDVDWNKIFGVYSRSKLLAESLIQDYVTLNEDTVSYTYAIVRTVGLFGYRSPNPDAVQIILDRASKDMNIGASHTLIRNYTYIPHLADAILNIIVGNHIAENMIYHIASKKGVSQHNFVRMVLDLFGFPNYFIDSSYKMTREERHVRPMSSVLDVSNEIAYGIPIHKVSEGIEDLYYRM